MPILFIVKSVNLCANCLSDVVCNYGRVKNWVLPFSLRHICLSEMGVISKSITEFSNLNMRLAVKSTSILKDLFINRHRGVISLIFYPMDDMGANSGLKPFIPQGNFWVLLIWSTRPGLKVHFVTFFSYHRIKKLLLQNVFVFLSNRIKCRKKIKNDIRFVTKGSFRHFSV